MSEALLSVVDSFDGAENGWLSIYLALRSNLNYFRKGVFPFSGDLLANTMLSTSQCPIVEYLGRALANRLHHRSHRYHEEVHY